jgi:hypothetical protein
MREATRVGWSRVGLSCVAASLGVVLAWPTAAVAQALPRLNEHCIVSVLNRNVRVKPDGSWVLPNVPANFGMVRARATCIFNGQTVSGESAPFLISANASVNVPRIVLGATTPIPQSLTLAGPAQPLGQIGATATMAVTARYANGDVRNVTAAATGTRYVISNPAIASITSDGVVSALASGTVLVQATNEGTSGFTSVRIVLSADSDGDGIPDDLELTLGLDPNNPADAFEDPDRDAASNRDEALAGTLLRDADSDDDTILDGEELRPGADGFVTNPLSVDTDGDGVRDALEVATGSSPINPGSVNLAQALTALQVNPATFSITVNSVLGVGSQQLAVTGTLRDGTSLDLTSTLRGTNYASSDLNVCNFGAPDGRVFGGTNGSCTITITNAGFTAMATGSVTNFQPTSLSSIAIPGYANNVDVNGSVAYVAAGAAGLVVVNVAAPAAPAIVATADTPGNANDVRVVGTRAYVADGASGLRIFDVANPAAPVALGSLDTPGEANDVIVSGNFAYVADGVAGVHIVDVTNPAAPLLVRTVDTPGTARGVDIEGSILAVADDAPAAGLRVIDVSVPASAAIVGNLAIPGTAIDLDLSEGIAVVAAYTTGVQLIDVSTPTAPVLVGTLPGSAPNGFVPRDVQLAGQFALFAEQLFANAVAPIVDISNPSTPFFRGVLDFGQDFAGAGIAVSGPYVYWTGPSFVVSAENGTTGNTRLFIGQYIALEDRNGIAPTVTITSPAEGEMIVEGSAVTVRVSAVDDVGVSAVAFTVNDATVFVDTSEPFEARVTAPAAPGPMVLRSTATDYGGNAGVSGAVSVSVIPDPLTTVTGRVIESGGAPVAGATASVGSLQVVTTADGTFTIANVPTVSGGIVVTVTASINGRTVVGRSAPAIPVLSGTTAVGDIVVGARVGYYDLTLNTGAAAQVPPIVAAGLEAVNVGNLATADLSNIAVLYAQNPSNSGFGSFGSQLARLTAFVQGGGVLVLHDRAVSGATSVVPGLAGTVVRDFADQANIQIVDPGTLVTNGPGGIITNTSLDGGNSSSHGYGLAQTLPPGTIGVLSTGTPSHLVTFAYPYGAGWVIYSTIPLDHYLASGGALGQAMNNYAANVAAWAMFLRGQP